jgi:sugar phosphate permease
LVGDAGSLALAFTPGANLASTGVGIASSLARYSADKDRGTSGAGWQLALNLGMDAATALPFLGGVAKTGKV